MELSPTRAERLALRVLQVGAIAVVLAAARTFAFELDRFFVPKELVLHLTAVLGALLALGAMRRAATTRVDLLLALFLLMTALSALFATNRWLGLRALTISASAVALFWAARGLREAGLSRPLLNGIALAVVVAAATSLLQAYGVYVNFFSLERAPGGTLGNRNFVGHAMAFGMPVVFLAAFRAARRFMVVLTGAGVGIVAATLVLTRSRAAWVACAAVVLVFAYAMFSSPALRRDGKTWRRIALAVLFTAAGVAGALLLPNALHWRSDNPYLESVRGIAGYQKGSGHGRLIQYEHSMLMAAQHPIFGVGPGNWPVVYPAYATRNDPSMSDTEGGMTSNPWPSSDWIAYVAERGLAATILLVLALGTIALTAFSRLKTAPDADEALMATALLGSVAAAVVAGVFDAVLLLAMPALLVWTALGAAWPPVLTPAPARGRSAVIAAVLAISALGVFRSGAQLSAMNTYSTRGDRASLESASGLDPGNYRLHVRLARAGNRSQRCAHARAARSLFPNAEAAKALARACGR